MSFFLRKGCIVSVHMCQQWFKHFRWGNVSVNDWSRPDRPTEIDGDKITVLLGENSNDLAARDFAGDLQISQTSFPEPISQNWLRQLTPTLGRRPP